MKTPDLNCRFCPRLFEFRAQNKDKFPDKFNAPVPSFGDLNAQVLVVGLAPGLKGANFSGRPFTGDYAGDLLYATLLKFGFARGEYARHKDDGLELVDCRVTNAVRCVPPENKPTTDEMNTCRDFLKSEIAAMPNLRTILSLGLISHNAVLKIFGHKISAFKFAHGAHHHLNDRFTLVDSYHCSRYNTQTKRLTTEMFETIFSSLRGV
ncbi:MAG TPA: uracil-DNA glycosylase [Alphaproteobacteria bacterium]|nr:uracil-DNA glycosylase [Alphaproteobacteria bacterium]USO05057.1 MAG: uracil-DNA glycosylase [Rhodospirillales bacterium]HOO81671.1 uracil-DNA glycosylase [Alphaproteobacteria bacterium]